jgi:phosphotriesterase-related protein
MVNSNLVGKVQTVQGVMEPEQLGVTLTHEHLLMDFSVILGPPPAEATAKAHYYQPLTLENLGLTRFYSLGNLDNCRLLDISTAIDEVNLYKQHGGQSLVDATSIGLSRDPKGLARISRATGVNIVMGASFYVAMAHPENMDNASEDELVERIVRDVTEGVDGSQVKSGIIGEIGCSWPLTNNERKVLRASARAQRITGAPILVHPGRDETAPLEIMEILSEAGGDLDHTIMGHLDRTVFLHSTLTLIAEGGCYLEWDMFGRERSYYQGNPRVNMPNDAKRMDDIAWVISQGYGNKVVVSHDIGFKQELTKYGGYGYHYILANIVPRMRARGYTEESIHHILVDNPQRVLAFRAPTSS